MLMFHFCCCRFIFRYSPSSHKTNGIYIFFSPVFLSFSYCVSLLPLFRPFSPICLSICLILLYACIRMAQWQEWVEFRMNEICLKMTFPICNMYVSKYLILNSLSSFALPSTLCSSSTVLNYIRPYCFFPIPFIFFL